jgi:hypothetical protein
LRSPRPQGLGRRRATPVEVGQAAETAKSAGHT